MKRSFFIPNLKGYLNNDKDTAIAYIDKQQRIGCPGDTIVLMEFRSPHTWFPDDGELFSNHAFVSNKRNYI